MDRQLLETQKKGDIDHQLLVQRISLQLDKVVFPKLHSFEWLFSGVNIIIILVVVCTPLVLTSPFFSEWSGCLLADGIRRAMSHDLAMQICDWLALIFTVAIFGAIGGIAFTDDFAKKLRMTVTSLRQNILNTRDQYEETRTTDRKVRLQEFMEVLDKPRHFRAKIQAAARVIGEPIFASERSFVLRGMVAYFPNGFYGILGFVFLVGLVYALSGKIILDHLPEACRWN
jgi:hypothetical protein